MNQLKTYRFKLKPTKAQQQSFAQLGRWPRRCFARVGTCRYVYNLALDTKIHAYRYGVRLSKFDLIKQLPDLKQTDWIKQVHSQTLQDVVERLDKAYQSFFKGNGFPKFAKKGFYSSFTFKQGVKLHQNTNTVQLPKIGTGLLFAALLRRVKYRKSQAVEGAIKTATISKQVDGWYMSLACEVAIPTLPTNTNVVGLDVGIKSLLVTSDGKVFGNPKCLYHYQKRLTKAQRSVSRKKKGGSNRKKAVVKLARLHLKVRNTRQDFHHQLSTRLIRENQTIVVENLQVSNLPKERRGQRPRLKNHKLAKSISDCGWYGFTQMLEYKAKWYGKTFLKVAPHFTSQDCSSCGARNSELTLADRAWTCSCGVTHDRDVNAAVNIKTKGVGSTLTACEVYSNDSSVAQESLAPAEQRCEQQPR